MENEKKGKGLAVASLVLGIVALVLCWIPIINFMSFVLGILALIFGIIAAVKNAGRGLGIAGLIIGILAMVFAHNINAAAAKAIAEGVEEWAKSYSGDITFTDESGEEITGSDWFSSLISEGIDEMNNQIQEGVEEFSEGVNNYYIYIIKTGNLLKITCFFIIIKE